MNEIRVGRMLVSGVITLLAFIAIEFIVERLLGQFLLGVEVDDYYLGLAFPTWTAGNYVLNIIIALVNCTMMMWLYAALRPMFGVGTRAVLITSAFALTFIASYAVNQTNLGVFPWWVTSVELLYQIIELPLALIVGAYFYELG